MYDERIKMKKKDKQYTIEKQHSRTKETGKKREKKEVVEDT